MWFITFSVHFNGLALLAWRAARCGGSLRCSDCGGFQPQVGMKAHQASEFLYFSKWLKFYTMVFKLEAEWCVTAFRKLFG